MLRDREFVILSFENLEKCPRMLPKIIEKLPGMWFGGCAWGYMGLDGFPVFLGVPLEPPGAPGGALGSPRGALGPLGPQGKGIWVWPHRGRWIDGMASQGLWD